MRESVQPISYGKKDVASLHNCTTSLVGHDTSGEAIMQILWNMEAERAGSIIRRP